MLKFAKNFKKSTLSLNKENKNGDHDSQNEIEENKSKTIKENDIDLCIKETDNCEDKNQFHEEKVDKPEQTTELKQPPKSNLCLLLKTKFPQKFGTKKLRLIIISGILLLIAVSVITILIVCLIQFSFSTNSSQNQTSTKSNSHFYNENLIDLNTTCNSNLECGSEYYSILIDNQCSCHLIKQNNSLIERLLCAKMGDKKFKCECKSGYKWSSYDNICMDINECDYENICSDDRSTICLNKIGSYECDCKKGFRWSELFERCADVNECLLDEYIQLCKIRNNSVCINLSGSYACECESGFYKSSNDSMYECLDQNECISQKHTCTNSSCNNLPGSYECCKVFEKEYECINCGYQFFKPLLNSTTNYSLGVSSRIIGGIESNPYSWPWIVSIGINYWYYFIDQKENKLTKKWLNISHVCGGTLISPYTVITAAHCLYNLEAKINMKKQDSNLNKPEYVADLANIVTVYAGVHDQKEDKKNRNFRFRVRKIYIHENFDSQMFLNDIALLILDQSVRKTHRVNWACLGNILNFDFPPINTTLYAAGFGTMNITSDSIGSNFLRQVDLKLLNFSDCDFVTSSMISDSKSQFCAGYLNGLKDTCTGDSGSPILYNYRTRWFIVGIVSYGQGCAQSFKPGINTNVSYYLDWINQRIKF